ncbi:SPOSA6832_03567, partial [Sporobolomyces salmonicolor]
MAASSGLFPGSRSSSSSAGQDDSRQHLFLQIKTVTVPLLEATRSPVTASSTRAILQLLEQLRYTLRNASVDAFSPALANYVFFPLSSLLQPRPDGSDRGDRLLEATMQVLTALVERWRKAGMEPRVRQELWIMTILTLGGPLNAKGPASAAKDKGKQVDRTEESKLAMVEALLALMRPSPQKADRMEEVDPLGERLDWSKEGPMPTERLDDPSPPLSILFHTLTTLLAIAVQPTSLQLQLSSLSALRILTTTYLARPSPVCSTSAGPSPLLATALPGTASTLSRIALSLPSNFAAPRDGPSRRQASAVIIAALEVLADVITLTVGDAVTGELRKELDCNEASAATLEELVETATAPSPPQPMDVHPSEQQGPPPPSPGPTVPTPSWLRFTLSSLSTLFAALAPLSSHDSPIVRSALAGLLSVVIQQCGLTLGSVAAGPIEGLIILAGDDWDDVRALARRALLAAFAQPSSLDPSLHPVSLASKIVQRRITALPSAARRRDEVGVQRGACLIRAALELLAEVEANVASLQGVEKWSWSLLSALEFDRVPRAGQAVKGGMALAWITGAGDGADQATSWPPIRLRSLKEQRTIAALEALWKALGRAAVAAAPEEDVIDQFLGVALGPKRGEAVAVSSLWVLDGVLTGLEGSKADKRRKKVLKRIVRSILYLLDEFEGVEDIEEPASNDAPTRTDVLVTEDDSDKPDIPSVQHSKGITATPSLDQYQPVADRSSAREARASHQLLLTSLALRVLTTCSSLLSASFQPFLMQSLYHVLAHLSPTTHPFLRAHAQHALSLIADSASYASPQNLVLANVDYVVNSVSQRLSVSRLDPSAPLVLVEMIRLVGQPIVPMVQDLVDDVFEALDDYHGYEEVTVSLWAVLDALIKVMAEELPPKWEESSCKAKGGQPNTEEDWASFREWFTHRHDKPAMDVDDDIEEVNPQRPFESGFVDDGDQEDGPTEFPETKETPPTRPQVATAQILSKALYFLSHSSPFLRARVLSLIASAVPLLVRPSLDADPSNNRSADLLPVIHRAWPYILNRFSDPEPYVVVEAAGLVEALASHVGEFMSRRILDDVWPRFRTLLGKQEVEDRKSAAVADTTMTRYSKSHRLYRAILGTMLHVARDVPLKEAVLWEQAVLLRRFLAVDKVDPELQVCARELYKALGQVNPDAVWLVLQGTIGLDDSLPRFLRMDKVDFGANIETLLQAL